MRRVDSKDKPLRLRQAGFIILLASLCWVLYSALAPIRDVTQPEGPGVVDARDSMGKDTEGGELARRVAGARLIRPAHVIQALKKDGISKALLEKVRFRGVVRKGEVYVAYLSEEGKGTRSVQKGDSILGMAVTDVAPGRVVLEFEGSIVELKH